MLPTFAKEADREIEARRTCHQIVRGTGADAVDDASGDRARLVLADIGERLRRVILRASFDGGWERCRGLRRAAGEEANDEGDERGSAHGVSTIVDPSVHRGKSRHAASAVARPNRGKSEGSRNAMIPAIFPPLTSRT